MTGGVTGTTLNGIVVGPTLGATNIGTTATNGVTTGGVNGIWVNGSVGKTTIVTDKDVTGTTGNGIISTTTTGANSVTANGGTVKGALWGILDTSATGNVDVTLNNTLATGNIAVEAGTLAAGTVTTNIDAASKAIGVISGYTTFTGAGAGVTNNAGLITTTNDNGLSTDTGIVTSVTVRSGINNTINNNAGGEIFGGFTDAGLNTVFNNNAGAVWVPGLVNAMNTTSTINNTGVIDVRQGYTLGVGVTNNLDGGLVDMTYGGTSPAASDYFLTYGFNAKGGSTTKFNVDFTAANSSGTEALLDDHSSNGLGTADTIGSIANPNPTGAAKISLVNIGAPGIATSGSVALILPSATGGAGMVDPGLGGLPTLVQSSRYVFDAGSDPSSGAVKVVLQEDAFGGVHLRWSPNITASSLGAYGGATGVGTPGGPSAGGGIIISSAGFAGAGGLGNSGGPGGGGASGRVADMAAGDFMSPDQAPAYSGSLKDGDGPVAAGCGSARSRGAWVAGEVARSNSDGGGDGRSDSVSGGVETSLGNSDELGCRKVAVGVFGFHGDSDSTWQTGTSKTDTNGVGGYVRLSSPMGLYASLLGAVGWSDSDLSNNIFSSTANKDGTNYMGVATLGIVTHLSPAAYADFRTYVAYGNANGDGFTDSVGIVVDGSEDNIVTVGGSVGLYAPIAATATGFVRGGVKWTQVDSSMSAFGIKVSGSADEVAGSVEAGFNARAGDGVEFGASGFGDFSETTTGYGGHAHLSVKF